MALDMGGSDSERLERARDESIEGRLDHIGHVYDNCALKYSELYILKKDGSRVSEDFVGYVPESVLGQNVFLFKFELEGDLFQRLTFTDNPNDSYQILATSKIPERK